MSMRRTAILMMWCCASSLVLFLVLAPILLPAIALFPLTTAPTDDQLKVDFQRHRASLEELAELAAVDAGLRRLWAEDIDPADADIPPPRLVRYRALMKDAGIYTLQHYHNHIYLISFTSGLAGRGRAKGYAFNPDLDDGVEVHGDLDEALNAHRDDLLLRRLTEGWFLMLDGR
jgi:hypothetical protein